VFVTNHVLSGVLIGRVLKNRPGTAFVVGVASHLFLDAIPHWGCRSPEPGKADYLTVARRDGILGLATMASAAVAVDQPARASTLAAMAGAVLLDLDKPSLHFLGVNPFPRTVQRLHGRVQKEASHGLRDEICFGFAFALADAFTVVQARRNNRRGPA
jgi:hypothetical protein